MHKVTDSSSSSFVHLISILVVLIPLGTHCALWLNIILVYATEIHTHTNDAILVDALSLLLTK